MKSNSIENSRYNYSVITNAPNIPVNRTEIREKIKEYEVVDRKNLAQLSSNSIIGLIPTYISNPVVLRKLIDENIALRRLLIENEIKLSKCNFKNFNRYTNDHMRTTATIAKLLCENINKNTDKMQIIKAARLHDVGKIFIPDDIVNKPDNLTNSEKKIMSAHSDLGYELLKSLKIDEDTLRLIKNHHNFDKNSPISQQIVSIADVYSALTEKRPYKETMVPAEAIKIIKADKFSPEVISALQKAIANSRQRYPHSNRD